MWARNKARRSIDPNQATELNNPPESHHAITIPRTNTHRLFPEGVSQSVMHKHLGRQTYFVPTASRQLKFARARTCVHLATSQPVNPPAPRPHGGGRIQARKSGNATTWHNTRHTACTRSYQNLALGKENSTVHNLLVQTIYLVCLSVSRLSLFSKLSQRRTLAQQAGLTTNVYHGTSWIQATPPHLCPARL